MTSQLSSHLARAKDETRRDSTAPMPQSPKMQSKMQSKMLKCQFTKPTVFRLGDPLPGAKRTAHGAGLLSDEMVVFETIRLSAD